MTQAREELFTLTQRLRDINFTKRSEFPGNTPEERKASWKQVYYATKAKVRQLGIIVLIGARCPNPEETVGVFWEWEKRWTRN
jgi:hypothetical protein